MTQKLKVLLVATSIFLLLSVPLAASIQKFPYVRGIWLFDTVVVYLEEVENGKDIRVWYLGQAHRYQGKSAEEIFVLVCSDAEEARLVAAFLNMKHHQWTFFYIKIGEDNDPKTSATGN